MTKDSLKTGMVVQYRNGDMRIVYRASCFDRSGILGSPEGNKCMRMTYLDSDLTHEGEVEHPNTIVKVYVPRNRVNIGSVDTSKLDLLWQRDDSASRTITLADGRRIALSRESYDNLQGS